ncbi:MAG: PD-(D/E)XK nuclease family protein [Planctomycetaceae bacterium]
MAHVELICGPAGSGKTARVLSAFRHEVVARQAEDRIGTALWITPSKRSRATVLRSLLAADLRVCFSPQVVTFDEFAEHLLGTASEAIQPLSGIAKRRLLRELIDDLSRRGKLKYFGKVADTPGFLDLCEAFISELKREEVWPEDFEKACRQADPGDGNASNPKYRELTLIYGTYQQRLHAAGTQQIDHDGISGLYDGEGRFWSARTLMKQGHRGPYGDLTLIVVDGFTDFTRTQYEMLAGLAGWAERMFVTLSLDRADGRGELFTKSTAALAELQSALVDHDPDTVWLSLPDRAKATVVGHLASHLFDNPREVPRSGDATGLAVLSCVRPAGEIETVAKRVKRLLVDGTPPDDVVVAFRTLDGIADFVRSTFSAAGIPAAVDVGPAITSTGAVRFLFALLDLERDDWAYPQLTGVLNSVLLQPDWPSIANGAAARAVSTKLRAFDLDGGREIILSALSRRLERADDDPQLAIALETLRRLSDELAPLRRRAVFSDWVGRLLHIASVLHIVPDDVTRDDVNALAANEFRGWQAFVRLLEESQKAKALTDGPAREIGLVEFRRQIAELLTGQRLKCEVREAGRVRVLSADQVRNLDVPHLFLCGLSESVFPQSHGDDCLYGDAERLRLRDHGVPLSHRARRSREEMLLFYGVVTRARQSLTLSYPSVNDGGEPLYPSPYVTAVLDLFLPEALQAEHCGRLDPVPAAQGECITASDLRVLATREALAGRAGLFATVASRSDFAETARNVAAAAEMATARFRTRGLTTYEGVLSDPRNLKRLRRRFGAQHEFSATELETYAANPFRYFLQYVLCLDPLVDPGPGTDLARRGRDLHAALAAMHRRQASCATDETAAELLVEELRREIEALFAPGGDSPLRRALRQIERDVLTKRADRYGVQWNGYLKALVASWDGPPTPARFEVPFGNMVDEDGHAIEPVNARVEFGTKADSVRVRGQIDRIDVGRCDGRDVFNVIDYKLTKSPGRFEPEDLELGRSLQLAIYAAAARRLGLVDAELFQLGFWSLDGKGFVCGFKGRMNGIPSLDSEQVAWLEETLDRVVPQLAESIRSGRFPVVPDDPGEQFNADAAAVARLGQFRSVAERLGKLRPGYEGAAATGEEDESDS